MQVRYTLACLVRALVIIGSIGACVWAFVRPDMLWRDRYGQPAIGLVLFGAVIVIALAIVSWPVKKDPNNPRSPFHNYWG